MATGACGINCDTCRLHRCGVCSSCGGGLSGPGILKLDTQKRVLGSPCPILACARLNRIDHCLADCDLFPCENFTSSEYPFGAGYLRMQQRRRQELQQEQNEQRDVVVPAAHWQTLREKDTAAMARAAGAERSGESVVTLTVLDRPVRIDIDREHVEELNGSIWQPASRLLSFVSVVYLANATTSHLRGRWVSEKDLGCAAFFRGFHQLPVERLLERFGSDPAALVGAAERLGGIATSDPGDAAVRLWVLPQIPVKLSLWRGDDELPAGVAIMFDQSIEDYLPADGIWAMVRLLCDTLAEQT